MSTVVDIQVATPVAAKSVNTGAERSKYFVYSSIGGLLWATGMTLLGQIPQVRDNASTILFLMLGVVVIISVVPIITEIRKKRREGKIAEEAASKQPEVS